MGAAKNATEPTGLHGPGVSRGSIVAILLGSVGAAVLVQLALGSIAAPLLVVTTAALAGAAVAILVPRTIGRASIVAPVAREAAPECDTPGPASQPAGESFAWDHMVLESLRDAVIVLDHRGRVVSANASAIAWFELAGTVRGRSGIDLLPGEPGKALGEAIGRVTGAGASEVQTTGLEHGRRKLDLDVVSMRTGGAGEAAGIVAAFADVTRNHELARLRDDLLSSISHELRTPLTNLCSSSEILAQIDPAQEPDWRDFVHILHTESHRLKSLVDDVMSYRQVENSRAEWHIEPHDADRLARNAEQLTSLMTRKAGVALDLQIESSAAVLCDGPRILEVLVRLVDNACKFGHRGGHVRLHVQALEDRVEFAVADDGPGIQPADRQRVFDRFVQVGDVLTAKPKGAGLGLSICQRIVDAIGGAIWCEDSPLGGIQVHFMLPLARGAAPCEDVDAASR